MFVFPAFNNSFKQRKRTFKCCKLCRNKRIRCSLSNNYEKLGCDNCKSNNLSCDLVSGDDELHFEVGEPLAEPVNAAITNNISISNIVNPDPIVSMTPPPSNEPIPMSVPSNIPSVISETFLKKNYNFNIADYRKRNLQFVGTSDPTAVFAQFNNSLLRTSKNLPKFNSNITNKSRNSKLLNFFSNINSTSDNIPTIDACAPRPKLRKRGSSSNIPPPDPKKQKISGSGVLEKNDSFEDLTQITLEANQSSNQTIGLYISTNNKSALEKSIKSPFLFQYLLSIDAFNLKISSETQFKLCQIYMWKVNSLFPIVFEDGFWTDYNNNSVSTVLLYSVIIAAARDDMALQFLQQEGVTDLPAWLDNLEDKIRGILMCDIELDKLTLLQVHLLLHLHTRNSEMGLDRSTIDLSIVLSYAMALGIHHKQQPLNIDNKDGNLSLKLQDSKIQQNFLCKLWWTIVIFDRMDCLLGSRAMIINKKDVSIEFPKDDKNMAILLDCAIKLEKMLSIYQPHGDKRVVPKDIDLDNDDDLAATTGYVEAVNKEFFFSSNSSQNSTPESTTTSNVSSTPSYDTFNQDLYVNNAINNLKTILKNTTIILSQKRHYDDPNIPKSIPDHNNSVAASKILTVIKNHSHSLPQIPFIPYAISLTMTIFLRIGFKKIVVENLGSPQPQQQYYDWKDSIVELNKLSGKWWFALKMARMGEWFFSNFEQELNAIKRRRLSSTDSGTSSRSNTNANSSSNTETSSNANSGSTVPGFTDEHYDLYEMFFDLPNVNQILESFDSYDDKTLNNMA